MTPNDHLPDCSVARRDAHLRLVRRLRVGLVSAGVLGSVGVAGVVAAAADGGGAVQAPPAPAVGDAGGDRTAAPGDSFSRWRVGKRGGTADEGGAVVPDPEPQQDQGSRQDRAPRLQQGSGPAHGSTGGS